MVAFVASLPHCWTHSVQVLSTGVLAEAVPHVLCEAPYRVPLSHPALQQSQEAVQTHSHLRPFDLLAHSHYVRAP